jgi:hypothetical protein
MKDNPKIGDIIGCSDGDIGIVVSTHWSDGRVPGDSFLVEIAWSSGQTLTDSWRSQDFNTEDDMFHIMSRA